MKRLAYILGLCSLLLCSCSNSVNEQPVEPAESAPVFSLAVDSLEGMIRAKAMNTSAVLGTSELDAKITESPAMQVLFDYDFSIGRHEVTCGEFNALMKKSQELVLDCEDKDLPATNLTFYDAVLFANERSKAEGRDTAYTYTQANFDPEKHCVALDGFAFHPEVDAYRLPTEAEWVLVATSEWNAESSWTAENSDYRLHKVCEKLDTAKYVCDMVGNATELVNDWLGNFRSTTVLNYVGAPDGGAIGQRVVKGGSYRNSLNSITLYGRGDVYIVTSSTRAEYVGFRLAFGAIPNALWMGNDGVAASSRIIPLASSAVMRSLMGTYQVKLAFRNDLTGNLAFIDYSSGILSVNEISDSLNVYHPEISPDGKWAAFCTGLEGVTGTSALYVRELNDGGTNLVKLGVESAAIPRWRVLETGDTVIVYVTSAGNNKDESSFKSTSTWQVPFSDGKFGEPQKLFDGAYHGGISEDNTLAVTGARLLRARVADDGSTLMSKARDTVWYKYDGNAEQACNASLARDGSKRTLFLDFGGKTGRAFVGKNYGTHEDLLVVDSTGTLIQMLAAPEGYTFDHSEWIPNANFAVATLTNVNGAHSKIVLVNFSDSSVVELAEGDELWHPSLWVYQTKVVENETKLDLDSAGIYMNEGDDWGVALMRYNMELLWQYRDSVNVAVVGSSRPMYSLWPSQMSEQFFMVNFAQTPNSIHMSRDFLKNYLFPHLKKLKYVVLSLDIDFWNKIDGENSDNLFQNAYRKYPGYVYDKNHNYWQEEYPEGLLECTKNNLDVLPYVVHEVDRGAIKPAYCGGWSEVPVVEGSFSMNNAELDLYEKSFESLVDIIQSAENRNIVVVGVIFPQNPDYKNTDAFGRYGMRRSVAEYYISRFEELERLYPNFKFLDENKMGSHDYSNELFVDDDHLCVNGSPVLTAKIDSVLKTLD